MTIVVLGKRLEEIGMSAFYKCTLPSEIVILPTIRVIEDWAF